MSLSVTCAVRFAVSESKFASTLALACAIAARCVPSATKSSTAVTVTGCGWSQSAGVNVRLVVLGVSWSSGVSVTVTSCAGIADSVTK